MDSGEVIVESSFVNDSMVAHLEGEIDAHTAPALMMTLDELLDPTSETCLDLSAVSFLDSSGLRVLALQMERFERSGGRLEISSASSPVRRILDLSGVAYVFDGVGRSQRSSGRRRLGEAVDEPPVINGLE